MRAPQWQVIAREDNLIINEISGVMMGECFDGGLFIMDNWRRLYACISWCEL